MKSKVISIKTFQLNEKRSSIFSGNITDANIQWCANLPIVNNI